MWGFFICFLHYLLLHKSAEGFIMDELNENEFTEIVIDLTKGKEMHEDWSAWMG